MKLHAVNSTSFRLLYRTTIRVNTALIFAAPSQSLKNITLRPFRKLVRPGGFFRRKSRPRGDFILPKRRHLQGRGRSYFMTPAVPSDIPGGQYFEYVTANSIFILFIQISLNRVVIK